MQQTRRQVLNVLAAFVAGAGGIDGAKASEASDTINTDKKQQDSRNKNMPREGYLALPGFCFTTLYTHLSQILNYNYQQPAIIIDKFDHDRLMGRVVRERDNQDVQMRGAITDTLRRRGILKTVDYSRFYTLDKKAKTLREYRQALESLPEDENQRIADTSLEGYSKFGRGDYVSDFRKALGSWDNNMEKRGMLQKNRDRIKRGLNDPRQYNEDVAAQYLTAHAVRKRLNRHSNFNIVGILGQGEQHSIAHVLRKSETEMDSVGMTQSEGSLNYVGMPSIKETKAYHDVFATIKATAQKATGVQYHDWYTIGPRLSVAMHPDLYDRADVDILERNTTAVAQETRQVLNYLDKEAADNQISNIQYRAEKISEEHEHTNQQTEAIAEQLGQQANLANHSREIRSLQRNDRFSDEALFVASSIKTDPTARHSTDWIYRRAQELRKRLTPISVTGSECEFFIDRGDFKRGAVGKDWYHAEDQQRRAAIPH